MRTIVAVQALRAFAAISVAIVHFNWLALALAGENTASLPFYTLASGVDIFFVISGFIMVYSSRNLFQADRGYRLFLIRRFCRIVPVYWLATLVAIYVMTLSFDPKSLLESMFFIPFVRADGTLAPLHGVGWSLNFEMFFYCIFASALRFNRLAAVICVSALLLIITLSGVIYSPIWVPWRFWSDPITIEFTFGMVIGLLYERNLVIPPMFRLTAIAVALGAFWLSEPTIPPSDLRFLVWGLPAALLLGACVLGQHEPDTGPFARFVNLLGDASYGVYLIHPLVSAVIMLSWPLGLNQYPIIAVLSLGLLSTICISIVSYWFVERHMTKALQQFFIARLASAPVATPAISYSSGRNVPLPSSNGDLS